MSDYPTDLHYTKDHLWVRVTGARWRIGLTSFFARQLGDLVFVEFPVMGKSPATGDAFGMVESVKSAQDLFMPAGGTIVAINDDVVDDPELINNDPYGDGWCVEITPKDASELNSMMDARAYENYVNSDG
ncbi:glycine cleavage system protein GcvH [Nannocystis punicea]|uniref:Glycine cleavage system H protein n=1 Tax=Nannocystis punicea TaxID=2995304 RepID=A0ABY7GV53_9BACT|nr:glycine cleavage system protein GcvH [Nannocystis poenicansa]WAS90853.1 glycine cleavage system protein GcvH [Nannocystis poenicansa]